MTLSTQFMTMLAMIGMGSYFGASLDTYNRFLNRTKRKRWIVFINDVLFWLLQGLLIFYVLFLVNQGELRFYIFLALLCGFAAYQSLLKQIYLRILEIVISMIISIYRFIVRMVRIFIYKPIQMLILSLISVIIFLIKGLFTLVKSIFRAIIFILKILFQPFKWILLLFWKLLPNNIKKVVDKLYNYMAGKLTTTKNILNKWISRWKKRKE